MGGPRLPVFTSLCGCVGVQEDTCGVLSEVGLSSPVGLSHKRNSKENLQYEDNRAVQNNRIFEYLNDVRISGSNIQRKKCSFCRK